MLSKYILWFLNQVSWICPQIRDMLLQSQTIRFLRLKPYRQWQIQVEVGGGWGREGGDGVGKGGDPFLPLDLGPYFFLTPNFFFQTSSFFDTKLLQTWDLIFFWHQTSCNITILYFTTANVVFWIYLSCKIFKFIKAITLKNYAFCESMFVSPSPSKKICPSTPA